MLRSILSFAFSAAAILLTGCASIVGGVNQPLSVTTKNDGVIVSGAKCSLTNDKGSWFLTTPGSVTVNRSFRDLAVLCSSDGMEPGTVMAKSTTKAMAFGNILFGGVIGVGVDVATGAAYDYPEIIAVEMGKVLIQIPAAPAQDKALYDPNSQAARQNPFFNPINVPGAPATEAARPQ